MVKRNLSKMPQQSTYRAFSGIIILAQCFGMLPMIHVRAKNVDLLQFRWKSFRFLHATILLLLLTMNVFIFAIRASENGLTFSGTVTFLFFGLGPLSSSLLMRLATKWPAIMRQWTEVDLKMESYGFPPGLKTRLYLTAGLIMSAALVEHSFFVASTVSNSTEVLNAANLWVGINNFLKEAASHVFRLLPYNTFFGLICKYVDSSITFVWNYMDMFIMTIALALAARFRQINERIQQIVEKLNQFDAPPPDSKFVLPKDDKQAGGLWMVIREDYNRLCRLTASINDAMAYIIVLSFANNLFLILVQLLHSLEPQEKSRVGERLYFAYSFGFLILRTCAVAMTSSQISVESRRPSWYLTTQLPEVYYDEEVERLLLQIRATGGCFLTGNGFFEVKSSLILGIAGAIVSYELIFIQFNLLS